MHRHPRSDATRICLVRKFPAINALLPTEIQDHRRTADTTSRSRMRQVISVRYGSNEQALHTRRPLRQRTQTESSLQRRSVRELLFVSRFERVPRSAHGRKSQRTRVVRQPAHALSHWKVAFLRRGAPCPSVAAGPGACHCFPLPSRRDARSHITPTHERRGCDLPRRP